MDFEIYSKELEVAVKVVHMACLLRQRVQKSLLFDSDMNLVMSKEDNSPVTVTGSDRVWMQPLHNKENKFVWPDSARLVKVSDIDNPELATFCEPVEKANSSHSFTAELAHSGGFRNQPLRVHSMVKYAAIAREDAEVFMKFPRAGYKEKIWDHAAGVVIVQESGSVVTDAGGRPLCFSRGMHLEGLDRGIMLVLELAYMRRSSGLLILAGTLLASNFSSKSPPH